MAVWNKTKKRKVYDLTNGKCYICDKHHEFKSKAYNIDHIKPKCEGGTNCLDNLKIACIDCNTNKGMSYNTPFSMLKKICSKFIT